MKKFNSILAIATVALTSVFGFTSCDKADDGFDTSTKGNTSTEDANSNYKYYGYQVFINDEALQYGDFKITAHFDGKSEDFNLSEGKTVTVTKEKIAKALGACNAKKDTYQGKIFTIPAFESKTGSVTYTSEFIPNKSALENVTPDCKTDFVVITACYGTNNSLFSIDVFNTSDESLNAGAKIKKNGTSIGSLDASRLEDYLQRRIPLCLNYK